MLVVLVYLTKTQFKIQNSKFLQTLRIIAASLS